MTTKTLDLDTLIALQAEANTKHDQAEEEFEDSDSNESMHEIESWRTVIGWLEEKIKKVKQ